MKKRKDVAILIYWTLVVAVAISIINFKYPIFLRKNEYFQLGYVGSNYGNVMNASFKYLNGTKSNCVTFKKGEKVIIHYIINLENGSLNIVVRDEDGKVVGKSTNNKGEIKFNVNKTEKYSLNLIANKAKGNFFITWNTTK